MYVSTYTAISDNPSCIDWSWFCNSGFVSISFIQLNFSCQFLLPVFIWLWALWIVLFYLTWFYLLQILVPPKDIVPKLEEESYSIKNILEKVKYRADWQQYQEAQKRKAEQQIEKERGMDLFKNYCQLHLCAWTIEKSLILR